MTKKKDAEILKLLKYNWRTRCIASYLRVQYKDVWRVQKENNLMKKNNNFEDFYY